MNTQNVGDFVGKLKVSLENYFGSLDSYQRYAWYAITFGLILLIVALILW